MLEWLTTKVPAFLQRRGGWKITCVAVYAGFVVLRFGIDEEVLSVLLVWLLLMHFVVDDENALRDSFLSSENLKEMRDSLHSILEVFPESIFIKKGGKHYFSNNAFAKKIGADSVALQDRFTEKLAAVEVREIEGRKMSDNTGEVEGESTSLLRFLDAKEDLVSQKEDM